MSKFNKRKAKKKLKLIKIRERVENDFNNFFFLSIWDLKKKDYRTRHCNIEWFDSFVVSQTNK